MSYSNNCNTGNSLFNVHWSITNLNYCLDALLPLQKYFNVLLFLWYSSDRALNLIIFKIYGISIMHKYLIETNNNNKKKNELFYKVWLYFLCLLATWYQKIHYIKWTFYCIFKLWHLSKNPQVQIEIFTAWLLFHDMHMPKELWKILTSVLLCNGNCIV